MNTIKTSIIYIILTGFMMVSCSYDFPPEEKPDQSINAEADFSRYYVIGDTYSSGFMDGALYKGGQEFSYPNLVAGRLNDVYEADVFQQAEVKSEAGFNAELSSETEAPKSKFSLLYRSIDSIYLSRATSAGDEINNWQGSTENLHDFSFPALKSYEADNIQKLEDNPYFSRIGLENNSPVDVVINRDPGIVVLNLGYSDILSYALNGGAGQENPTEDDISENDLTSVDIFEESLTTIVDRLLTQTDAHIFISNIFNLLEAPYFSTLSHALEIERYSSGYIGSAASYYTEYNDDIFLYNHIENGGVPAEQRRSVILFDPIGYPMVNPLNRARVIVDEYLPDASLNDGTVIPKWRQLNEKEIILYKLEDQLNEFSKLSGEMPLSDDQVLTEPEIAFIEQRVQAFNNILERLVSENERIHLVDMQSVINSIKLEQYTFEGVRPSLKFDRYGIFSSDGYTLNPRGNAIIANEFIRTINSNFDATLKILDPNAFRGNEFLSGFN